MVISLSHTDIARVYDVIGGKAANLCELKNCGMNIPKGFVISTEISSDFLKPCLGNIIRPLDYEQKKILFDVPLVHAAILNTDLPNHVAHIIYDSFYDLNVLRVAVRSSANVEDSKNFSFAGIFDTFLNIDSGSLIVAIKKCWASLFSKRALEYYFKNKINVGKVKMAVIIQEIIDADCAGVCFTRNPVSGNANETYIEVVYGLGEGLVSGKLTPDSYIYDKATNQIKEKNVNSQNLKVNFVNFIAQEVAVDFDLINEQKVSDDMIREISLACIRIQEYFQRPQDVEFAIKNNVLFFLQSRPITTF
jgi:pyruvate,water dikinase